jgi:predicted phage terminase large subunit-like protein
MEFPDLIKYLKKHTSKYQLSSDSKIFIEPKASGVSLAQTLRSETGLNIIETKAPDTDKVVRANAASPKMESRRVKLVAGMYIEDYLNQLAAFPNGSHDDMVDTTVMAIDTLLPANDNPDFLFV